MKKGLLYLLVGVLVLGLMFGAAGCGTKPADTGKVEQKKVLKVGTEASYAPMEYMDETGKITGFDIELITAIGEEMGYEVVVNHIEWDGLTPALDSGQIDAVISSVTITDERKETHDFSEPYFEATQLLVVKQDSPITGLADLMNSKVGVQASTTGDYAAQNAGFADENIIKYPTTPDALMNLANGTVVAVIADSPVVNNYIRLNPEKNFRTINDNFEPEFYGIRLKKGNAELLADINAGLAKLKENGKFDALYTKYFK